MIKFRGGAIVPGSPRVKTLQGDSELPQNAEVVVIGGGLLGCIAALILSERDLSVTLCEKGVIAGEASGRAAGLIEYEHLSPIKFQIVARSLDLWREIAKRVGSDIGYSDRGLITLFESEQQAAKSINWLEEVRGLPGLDAQMLSADEIQGIDVALGSGWHSALLQKNGAAIEPKLAAPVIAEAARRNGARILQHCAVLDISLEGGKVASVVTERGIIHTPNVVIAGGVWSSRLAKKLGLELPQLMIFAEMVSVEPLANGPGIPGLTPAGYFRREPDGGYMFGTATGVIPITPTVLKHLRTLATMPMDVDQEMSPVFNWRTFWHEWYGANKLWKTKKTPYERNRIFQPEFVGATSASTLDGMRKQIPAFSDSKVRERYTGALITTIDNLGVLSSVGHIPGLYLGTGMLYGVTMAAAAGEAIADMITGEKTKFDLTPYRYERFVDGSPLSFYA